MSKKAWKDKLKGGKADKKKPSDFPSKDLKEGKQVEREHIKDSHLQTEIAMDHLTEDPKYYKKLKTIEKDEKKSSIQPKQVNPKDPILNYGKVPKAKDPKDIFYEKAKAFIQKQKSMKKALEEESIKDPKAKAKFRAERKKFSSDPYASEVTSTPGVSDRGIEARRANPKMQGVISYGYGRIGTPEFHAKRAKNYFRQKLNRIKSMPKPNLPKSELEKSTNIMPQGSNGKPKLSLKNWSYKKDTANNMVHFQHPEHGTVSIRPNHKPSGKDYPYEAVHNGAPIGRFKSPYHATAGVAKYIKSIAHTSTTRMLNVDPTKKSNDYFNNLKKTLNPQKFHAFDPHIFSRQIESHWEDHFKNKQPQLLKDSESKVPTNQDQPKAIDFDKETSIDQFKAKNLKSKLLKPKSRHYNILTDEAANTKTSKNARNEKYLSAILHLAPANLSGVLDVCPGASEGCRQSCLNTAGHGSMITKDKPINTIHEARMRRTRDLALNPDSFFATLDKDIQKVVKNASKENKHPVIRLNGTSDINWAKFRPSIWGGKNVFEAFPDVQFYDYSKMPGYLLDNKHSNYHITFSRSEVNEPIAKRLLDKGHNVAIVFGGKELPKEYLGRPVISGDQDDLRFLDPRGEKGYIIGLKAKGDATADKSGFVVWGHEGDPSASPSAKDMKSKILLAGKKNG